MNAQPHSVIGLGELLWDVFPDLRLPGGAPANVAYHARQLGLQGIPVSRVGDDDLGRELVGYVRQRGLATQYIQTDPIHPTGIVTVDDSLPGRPSYTIHEETAWDYLAFDKDLEELAGQASAICFGTLAQRNATSRETIHRCLAAGSKALLVYYINLRQSFYNRETIEPSLQAADVVKLSIDEITPIASLLNLPTEAGNFAEVLREQYEVRLVSITRSEHGCLVCSADETADIPGFEIEVADGVGAGDAFTAALIYGLLSGWSVERTALLANRIGALVASRAGAMPDIRDAVPALLQEYAA